jgi:methylated-DNA-[protein]-cysteine S-methyltransferase
MKELFLDEVPSPIGVILTVFHQDALCALDYTEYEARMRKLLERRFGEVKLTARRDSSGVRGCLEAYFAGEIGVLDDIEVDCQGTGFQTRVWSALRTIAPGQTASYGEIAARLGCPSAARAVGLANSLNPVAIVVPCHRVVGAKGKLTGYAGGLDRKRWLLDHERQSHTHGIDPQPEK